MSSKYSKNPVQVFSGVVSVPILGDDIGLIDCRFRYVRRKEYLAKLEEVRHGKISAVDMLEWLIDGWDHAAAGSLVTAPYSRAELDDLVDSFWGAEAAFFEAYGRAQTRARAGN